MRRPKIVSTIWLGFFDHDTCAFMTLPPFLRTAARVAQQATGCKISPGWGLAFEVVNELG